MEVLGSLARLTGFCRLASFGSPREFTRLLYYSSESVRDQLHLCDYSGILLTIKWLIFLISQPLFTGDAGRLISLLLVFRCMYFCTFFVVASAFLKGIIAGSYVVARIIGWLMR